MRTEWTLRNFVLEGYEYVKLDFIAHGTLEGRHHRPDIQTGIQAYRYGMQHIIELLDPERIGRPFFIHLSTAPLFPHPYTHGRRISCDAFGELKDTEYMLDSLTYGWWINDSCTGSKIPTILCFTRATTMNQRRSMKAAAG